MAVTPMGRLFYARHVFLLVVFGVLLDVATLMRLLSNVSVAFAVYGALHATAIALALRRPQPVWRRVSFVVIAAVLSLMTLRIGMIAMQYLGPMPLNSGLYLALGFSAIIAAMSYGLLIRSFGVQDLTWSSLPRIGLGCAIATYAAFFALAHTHWLGRWLLAVFWWCAFSGGLWYYGPGRSRSVG